MYIFLHPVRETFLVCVRLPMHSGPWCPLKCSQASLCLFLTLTHPVYISIYLYIHVWLRNLDGADRTRGGGGRPGGPFPFADRPSARRRRRRRIRSSVLAKPSTHPHRMNRRVQKRNPFSSHIHTRNWKCQCGEELKKKNSSEGRVREGEFRNHTHNPVAANLFPRILSFSKFLPDWSSSMSHKRKPVGGGLHIMNKVRGGVENRIHRLRAVCLSSANRCFVWAWLPVAPYRAHSACMHACISSLIKKNSVSIAESMPVRLDISTCRASGFELILIHIHDKNDCLYRDNEKSQGEKLKCYNSRQLTLNVTYYFFFLYIYFLINLLAYTIFEKIHKYFYLEVRN